MKIEKNNNHILVSVSVVTYNHANYINQCLDSILMQETDFPVEINLGEDGSTDGTREICQEYAKKHPDKISLYLRDRKDVIYISGNPTGRFNFTENLKAARGKYIALCEGDDYWTDPLKLQKQVDLLENNKELVGSYSETDVLNEDGSIFPWTGHLPNDMTLNDVIAKWSPFHTSSFIFKKAALPDFPKWFYQVASGDMFLFAVLALKGKFAKVDTCRTVYRKHGGGVTNYSSNKDYCLHLARLDLWVNFKTEYDIKLPKIDEVIVFHSLGILKGIKITSLAKNFIKLIFFSFVKFVGKFFRG
ncbi:MAG: glycosyltransferase [Nitrospinota bacterium]